MNWLFGSASPAAEREEPPDALDTMDRLQESLDALHIRKARIDAENADIERKAKEAHAKGNRALATRLLKSRRKTDRLDGQIANLEATIDNLDSVAQTATLTGALQQGSHAMKAMMTATSVEDVEDIQEELSTAVADASELQDVLARPLYGNAGGNNDDDDVAALFDEWEAVPLKKEKEEEFELPAVPDTALNVPAVVSAEKLK